MTQGYGPEDGRQDQGGAWGRQDPPPAPQFGAPQFGDPQFGAAPAPSAWGQASPAAPGGHPGAAGRGGPWPAPGEGVDWRRVRTLGRLLLIGTALLLVTRLGINLATFVAADELAVTDPSGTPGALLIGTGVTTLVLFVVNLLLSLGMMILGLLAAVKGRQRARVGGIVVAAAIPVSVVLYWILSVLVAVVLFSTGGADIATGQLTGSAYRLSAGIDALRTLLMVAVIALGSSFVHRTATRKLAA